MISCGGGTEVGRSCFILKDRNRDRVVILDAGSGIIKLGKELMPEILENKKNSGKPQHITILFTHTHNDHLLGLPFFAPLYMPDVYIHFIGPATLGVNFYQILRNTVVPQYFPVSMDEFRSTKTFYNLNENMFIYFDSDNPEPQIGHISRKELPTDCLLIQTMKYYCLIHGASISKFGR